MQSKLNNQRYIMKKTTQKTPNSEARLLPRDQLAYEQEISRRAYELWEAAGGQHGEDMTHWLTVEREVQARRLPQSE